MGESGNASDEGLGEAPRAGGGKHSNTHTHTHLCNPPSGLVGNSQYSVFVNTQKQDLKRIQALPMAYLLPCLQKT